MSTAPRWTLAHAALGTAIFVLGVAVGVLADRALSQKRVIRMPTSEYMSRVLDQLNLTPEQRAQANEILERRAPGSEAIMVDLSQRLHAVADSVDAELRAILTPAQRAKLDSLQRNRPRITLRRKVIGPGGTTIDSVVLPGQPNPMTSPR